jgi:hypothetical protein
MKKIDKTLAEVRRWKARVSAKTRKMKPAEVVAYFREASTAHRRSGKTAA